jgi:hypothetical protein
MFAMTKRVPIMNGHKTPSMQVSTVDLSMNYAPLFTSVRSEKRSRQGRLVFSVMASLYPQFPPLARFVANTEVRVDPREHELLDAPSAPRLFRSFAAGRGHPMKTEN